MKRISADTLFVLVALALLLAFALGLILGARVESALHKQLAAYHAVTGEIER